MQDSFKTLITGLVGAVAIAVTNPITPEQLGKVGQIVIQIIIGIVTIWQLFKKPKSK